MKFIVDVPDVDTSAEQAVKGLRGILESSGLTGVTVVPHPYEVEQDTTGWQEGIRMIETFSGHNGPRTVYVWFYNGSAVCSCHGNTLSEMVSIPSLR